MKEPVLAGALALLGIACFGPQGLAQSLGDVARQARAEKAAAPKARRVFTNENMPREGGLSTYTTPAAPAPAAKGKEEKAAGAGTAEDKDKKKASAEEEKEWRQKFAALREKLSYEERKLDVLQRELNLAQIQNYSDPNVALREQHARTEINTRMQEMEKQKAAVDSVKKEIAALEEELRRKNLPPGWAQ